VAYPLYFNPDYSVIDRSFRRLVEHAHSWHDLLFSMITPTRRVMLTPAVHHPNVEGMIISYWEGFNDIAFTKIPLNHIHGRFPTLSPLLPDSPTINACAHSHDSPLSSEYALELACSCALAYDGIVTLSSHDPLDTLSEPSVEMLLELHLPSRAPIRRTYLVTHDP
jgi:hypothetical protein